MGKRVTWNELGWLELECTYNHKKMVREVSEVRYGELLLWLSQ